MRVSTEPFEGFVPFPREGRERLGVGGVVHTPRLVTQHHMIRDLFGTVPVDGRTFQHCPYAGTVFLDIFKDWSYWLCFLRLMCSSPYGFGNMVLDYSPCGLLVNLPRALSGSYAILLHALYARTQYNIPPCGRNDRLGGARRTSRSLTSHSRPSRPSLTPRIAP